MGTTKQNQQHYKSNVQLLVAQYHLI